LQANPSLIFETHPFIVSNYVDDARHDKHLKHRYPKNHADRGDATTSFQAQAPG